MIPAIPPPPPDFPSPPPEKGRPPVRLAIALLAALAWLLGSWPALHSLGWFPPRAAKIVLVVGWIPVSGLGLAIGGMKGRGLWTAGVCFLVFALVAPWLAANFVPGVKQPSQYAIPGQPWIALTAAPDDTYDLYLMRGDARHLTAYGETPWTEWSPELSPDRRRIVFSSDRHGSYDLYLMELDANGDEVRTHQLTDGPGDELSATWSPDGSMIAYEVQVGSSSTIDLIDSDGGEPKTLTRAGGHAVNPGWSADGTWIGYSAPSSRDSADFDIWIMRADGSDARDAIDASRNDLAARWSPDGSRIAITGTSETGSDVYVAEADGSNLRNITGSTGEDEAFGWTPDGSKVLFLSDRSHTGGTFLYFMDPDGTDVRLVLRI